LKGGKVDFAQGPATFIPEATKEALELPGFSEDQNGKKVMVGFGYNAVMGVADKIIEAECFAQYAKLCRKIAAGAQFIITQLGYDAYKFAELISILKLAEIDIPVFDSTYVLTPRAARIMNQGAVPGAVVADKLLKQVEVVWLDRWSSGNQTTGPPV